MKQRTKLQNRSLHKFFELLADAFNEAGLDVQKTLRHDIEIPWNETLIKELIWRPIMEAMTDKSSTTEMDTVDPSQIYEVLNRHLGEKFGLHVDWPCEESLYQNESAKGRHERMA